MTEMNRSESGLSKATLLVLGAGRDQVFMIKTAKQMGVCVLAVDGNPKAEGFEYADHAFVVSNRDVEAICTHIQASSFVVNGVSTMGSDIPHVVAAVAHRLSCPAIDLASARRAVDKYEMKECFSQHGIRVPDYRLIDGVSSLRQCLKEWHSVVIKPLDQAGSRGVFLLRNNDARVEELFRKTMAFSANGKILVERYIPGDQLSTESLIVEGRVYTPGMADRNYDDLESFLPQIIENGGWVPSIYVSIQSDVDHVVQQCAQALGIKNGVIKGDLIIRPNREVIVVETAARLSGGDFSESLVPLSSGINYVEQVIRQALGLPVELDKLVPRKAKVVANRYFFPRPGKLLAVKGGERITDLPWIKKFELWYRPGDDIPEIDGHGARGGVFVVEADDRETCEQRINEVYNSIEFDIA